MENKDNLKARRRTADFQVWFVPRKTVSWVRKRSRRDELKARRGLDEKIEALVTYKYIIDYIMYLLVVFTKARKAWRWCLNLLKLLSTEFA